MPDSTGKLTQEEYQRAVQWINTRWMGAVPCEMCGAKQHWDTLQYLVAPPNVSDTKQKILTGYFYPQFMVLCTNCGNTKYVNAYITGVVTPLR